MKFEALSEKICAMPYLTPKMKSKWCIYLATTTTKTLEEMWCELKNPTMYLALALAADIDEKLVKKAIKAQAKYIGNASSVSAAIRSEIPWKKMEIALKLTQLP